MKLIKMKLNNETKLNFKIIPPNEGNVKREIACLAGIKAVSIDENGEVYGWDLMMGIEELLLS